MVKKVQRFYGRDMRAAETGPLEASWNTYPQSIDEIVCRNWKILVARSRLALNDDGFFKEFIKLVKNNIVGSTGFRVESTPMKRNGKIDQAAKSAIDDAWEEFSEKGNFDVTGQMSRVTLEELWATTKFIDGEVFALVVVDPNLPWGFGIQMIDAMRLDPNYNEDLNNGCYIRHSIEYNHYGRPIAYHISDVTTGSFMGYHSLEANKRRISAEFVIHDFIPEFIGQKRGLPQLRSILWRLRQFSKAEDSMISNLRASASKMGFFTSSGVDEEPPPAGGEDEEGDVIAIDNADAEFYDIGNKRMIAYSPQFPDTAVEPFMRTLARGIASGMGANYYKVFNDLTAVSFSSIRQGELSERDFWKSHQTGMIDNFVRPFRQAWLKYSLLAGRIWTGRRILNPADLKITRYASFKGRTWGWIDPQSEAAASALMLERNMMTLTQFLSNQGIDFWEFIETLQNERKEMEEKGIYQVITPGGGVLASPGKTPKEESTQGK